MADKQKKPPSNSVPVQWLRFIKTVHVGGMNLRGAITTKLEPLNTARTKIEYHPALRSFKIVQFRAGSEKAHATIFVNDSQVQAWRPVT